MAAIDAPPPALAPSAEDVVQDAMVRAVRALRNGSRPEAVGAWLHRITRNCAIATALKADCADGAIDGSYPSAAVVGALRASEDGQEYGGCKQALTQASLLRHHP